MHVVIMGPPGSGKSTISRVLAQLLGVELYDSGERLRAVAETNPDLKAGLARGEMSPDELVSKLVADFVAVNAHKGAVWCGFPRHGHQADELVRVLAQHGAEVDTVVVLDCSLKVVLDRVRKRRDTEGRDEDTDEVTTERYRFYDTATWPLARQMGTRVCPVNVEKPLWQAVRDVLNVL